MLLAVDIGNSSIKLGVFSDGEEPVFTVRFAADRVRSADEYAIFIQGVFRHRNTEPEEITDAVLSSVAPQLTHTMEQAIRQLFGRRALTVGAGVRTGFNIRTEAPAEIGADIIANTAAAVRLAGAPAIIADLGTATTVFALNGERVLVGGVILPGVGTGLEALRASAAQLPFVALEKPAAVIGRNTAESISSGLIEGHAICIDGFIDRFCEELGLQAEDVALFATGGCAPLVTDSCRHHFRIEPHLTLKGLRVILENTRRGRK